MATLFKILITEQNNLDEFRDFDTNESDAEVENTEEIPTSPTLARESVENDDTTNPLLLADNEVEEPYMLDLPEPSGPLYTGDIFAPVGV